MGFQKGQSGNLKGRPKGAKKTPVKVRLEKLLDKHYKTIEGQLDQYGPEQKTDLLLKIAAVVIDKPNSKNIGELLNGVRRV